MIDHFHGTFPNVELGRNPVRASRGILHGNLELREVPGSATARRDSSTNTHNYRVNWYTPSGWRKKLA